MDRTGVFFVQPYPTLLYYKKRNPKEGMGKTGGRGGGEGPYPGIEG